MLAFIFRVFRNFMCHCTLRFEKPKTEIICMSCDIFVVVFDELFSITIHLSIVCKRVATSRDSFYDFPFLLYRSRLVDILSIRLTFLIENGFFAVPPFHIVYIFFINFFFNQIRYSTLPCTSVHF